MTIQDDIRPESFYSGMTEPELIEGYKVDLCQLCDEQPAVIEVTFGKRKELACLSCYSTPDYQEIIKRDNAKIKLI